MIAILHINEYLSFYYDLNWHFYNSFNRYLDNLFYLDDDFDRHLNYSLYFHNFLLNYWNLNEPVHIHDLFLYYWDLDDSLLNNSNRDLNNSLLNHRNLNDLLNDDLYWHLNDVRLWTFQYVLLLFNILCLARSAFQSIDSLSEVLGLFMII